MPIVRRITTGLLAGLLAVLLAAPAAMASRTQVAMFQEDAGIAANLTGTLRTLHNLGVGVLRYTVHWAAISPAATPYGGRPPGFQAADPSWPGYDFSFLDRLVQEAPRYGITVDLSVTGPAPIWANGRGQPIGGPVGVWRPSAGQFGQFVAALGARYTGSFTPPGATTPLPAVRMWEIWNEPNFGPDLAPQAVNRSTVPASAPMYRALVDTAWNGLKSTNHLHDTIILGNLDARGQSGPPSRGAPQGFPGNYAATKPLVFLRDLYCVDGRYRPLRGVAARVRGCPTTAAGAHGFARAHPALFAARGFGDHPYPLVAGLPPTQSDSSDPDYAEFSQLGRFARVLDRLERTYHSGHRFAIYNNEYGYITNPPNRNPRFTSPAVSAADLNWAEYLSWLNPRLATTMQFLLRDPNPRRAPEYGGFASGLEFYSSRHKPGYDAYRLPIFLPVTSVRRGRRLLVWGCARPAHDFGNPMVLVQFQSRGRGPFRVVATVSASSPRGYFETRIRLPRSGVVRLAWSYPGGPTVYSRPVPVTVR